MNRMNSKERYALPPCPVCGLDSGERMQSEIRPFLYYVRCTSCGRITKGFTQKNIATRAWKRGEVLDV